MVVRGTGAKGLSSKPTIVFVTGIIGGFQIFEPIQLISRGGPFNSTNVVLNQIYNDAFKNLDFGIATASATILALFLLAIRKSAYVQPFDNHLRLITPFLRMNISYRRIRQATSAEMGRIFPPEKFKGWVRGFLQPLAKQTVIVLELNGWPLQRWALAIFLSPFFFPDRSARIALFVPDWVRFSNELESFRSAWLDSLHPMDNNPRSNLLDSFSKK